MKALVIGGGGFLGSRICGLLQDEGHAVRAYGRGEYPHLRERGVTCVRGDVGDARSLEPALEGVECVFHVAARNGFHGRRSDFRRVNVDGTALALAAARAAGVSRFVYTSSPSVVGFAADVENGGMDLPYPSEHESAYSASKAEAERMVKAANGAGFATLCLRPHMIFGPGDRNLFPRMLRRARRGLLARVGDGTNRIDLTYVDNAAFAHLDGARALADTPAACAGRAYFISNDEPVVFYDYMDAVLRELGVGRFTRTISHAGARRLGLLLELLYAATRRAGEPPVTRYLADMFAHSHWYDMGPAKRDLGYRVRVSMAEATRATVRWFAERSCDEPAGRTP